MHELSIAQNILSISEKHLQKEKAKKVIQLTIDVGALSGVEYESLDFALEVVKRKSILGDANIVLNRIKGKARCHECKHDFHLKNMYDNCPKCKSYFYEIMEGKELKISSMIVD